MLVEVGPKCVETGTFPMFLLRGVLYPDIHGFLDGPGLAIDFLVDYAELVGVHGMACGGTVEVYGGGGLEVFLYSVTQCSA